MYTYKRRCINIGNHSPMFIIYNYNSKTKKFFKLYFFFFLLVVCLLSELEQLSQITLNFLSYAMIFLGGSSHNIIVLFCFLRPISFLSDILLTFVDPFPNITRQHNCSPYLKTRYIHLFQCCCMYSVSHFTKPIL